MRALLVVAAVVLAFPVRVEANPARELVQHMSRGARPARLGDWVTYRFNGGGLRVYYWRLAVVGEEKDKEGRDAVWVEMEAGTHPAMKSPLAQMRMLVAREGDEIRYDAISRLYIGTGFGQPQEYSDEALQHVLKQQEADAKKAQSAPPEKQAPLPKGVKPTTRSGKESRLMTLAGTVAAVPVEVVLKNTVIKRMWLSREIPLLNLAKIEIPGIGHAMEVAEYGIDAKPRMRIPAPDAPKIKLEYADAILDDLPGDADDGHGHDTPEDTP
ncbi:hypothetical protein [Myxococcus xanthus]|uniref:DUF3108 domain-containing protein n=1 Tax=Myxococcus xanthus TaxID=34 RepID=A0A7Y4ID78_MYXXA|nr:hypothetical protein [Myxococcus xanthus]NOJ87683.1 hypothetical protein [Myxococcus xanthus]